MYNSVNVKGNGFHVFLLRLGYWKRSLPAQKMKSCVIAVALSAAILKACLNKVRILKPSPDGQARYPVVAGVNGILGIT